MRSIIPYTRISRPGNRAPHLSSLIPGLSSLIPGLSARIPGLYTPIPLCTFMLLLLCTTAHAQQPPPRPISVFVNPAQGLNFGAFYQGVTGGTVTVFPDGSRSTTGDIVQANLGIPFSPAIYEIDANVGTLISIMNGPDITLTGSNGGTIHLHIGASRPTSPLITTAIPPARTQVMIGGTLTVGPPLANPSGSYSGTFSVTFIQQ